jgi:2-oxoglutarate/2-oxoacid ferredoxin oxidoreductase subunit alpha
MDEISLVLCGAAGQGVQTVEEILARIAKLSGWYVFSTKEYMSRIRGGSNSTSIRISKVPVRAPIKRADVIVPLDAEALAHLKSMISKNTIIIGEKSACCAGREITDIPFSKIAEELGNKIFSNVVATGAIAGGLGLDKEIGTDFVKRLFFDKGLDMVAKNAEAFSRGYTIGAELKLGITLGKNPGRKNDVLLSGSDAISLGAIAGGCNFISAYPMTPSTGIFTFLSQHAKEFGIIAEQAEDEISGINMALGAWYAGGRAMANTSGGGFDLIQEGVSLAGIIESPIVISLAQRPGPATGLPTRTEQGDLNLALYSGHGEFPRAILTPGNIEQAFKLGAHAFNLADKYQVPVFILSDQYLNDTYYNIDAASIDPGKTKIESYVVKTAKGYNRYAFAKNGISPRGIPGGEGMVCADSDEHDETGHITEDDTVRTKMVDKRLKKLEGLKKDAVGPELVGKKSASNLVICWGSTYEIVREAIADMKGVSMLHFSQAYPLHKKTSDYLKSAKNIIAIENNATGQFARLIKLETGFEIEKEILKYDGLAFDVEGIKTKLGAVLR